VPFEWASEPGIDSSAQFMINIKRAADTGSGPKSEWNIHARATNSGNRWEVMFTEKAIPFGEYFWTIRRPEYGEATAQPRGGDTYRHFSIYPSVLEKIKATKQLVIGTSVTVDEMFLSANFEGFENDLVNKLLSNGINLPARPAIKWVRMHWDDLLPKLQDGEIDLVMSSMTKTADREKNYRIRFTDGYWTTHQRFVIRETGGAFGCLRNKMIGVLEGLPETTNQIALDLFSIYGIEKGNIRVYPDIDAVFGALGKDVDVVLVDDIAARRHYSDSDNVEFYGPELDSYLAALHYYDKGIGYKSEQYAIAVASDQADILSAINGGLLKLTGAGELASLQLGAFQRINKGLTKVSKEKLCW
jgi:ABC-type amino acid transport substrate-binding protein